ncbi:MAG TPA: hypothetical protein VGB54_07335 [Allosphingosinicella sp.]|jgi:hypothetical protein
MSLMSVAIRQAGTGRLDKPVAAFAAAAAAATLFMMPIGMIETLVVESGLSSFVSAAAPPLGSKARIAFALIAAALVFGLVLLLMRMLGRAQDMFEPEDDAEREPSPAPAPAPRVRRRDQHPDAPARAPFSVTRDMGVPDWQAAPSADPAPAPADPAPAAPDSPRRRAPLSQILAGETQAPPAAEPERSVEERLRRIKPGREPDPDVAAPPPVSDAPEPVAELEEEEEELLLANPEPQADPAPDAETRIYPAEPETRSDPEPPIPVPALEPVRSGGQESLPDLMARLERALDRRTPDRHMGVQQQDRVEANAPAAGPEPMDTRLRSALENLKRFAPRHG